MNAPESPVRLMRDALRAEAAIEPEAPATSPAANR